MSIMKLNGCNPNQARVISILSFPAPILFLLSLILPISPKDLVWVPPQGNFIVPHSHHHLSGFSASG